MNPAHEASWAVFMNRVIEEELLKSIQEGVLDIHQVSKQIAFRSISHLVFGEDLDDPEAIMLVEPIFAEAVKKGKLRAVLDEKMWSMIPDGYMQYGKNVLSHFSQIVDPYLKHEKTAKTGSLLEHFIDLNQKWNDERINSDVRIDSEWIVSQIVTMYAAGSDTTRHAMNFIVRALHEFPDQQAKLRDALSQPTKVQGRDVYELSKIPEITYFVDEVLRLNPPAPLTLRVAGEDFVVGGTSIPKGTLLVFPILLINRSASFGDDHDSFNPDRYNTASAAPDSLSFFHGLHKCIGEGFALTEIRLFLTQLLLRSGQVQAHEQYEAPGVRVAGTLQEVGGNAVYRMSSNQ